MGKAPVNKGMIQAEWWGVYATYLVARKNISWLVRNYAHG